MLLNRRRFIAGCSLLPFLAQPALGGSDQPLRTRAARQNRLYGAAVSSGYLKDDPIFAQTVAREAGILVAEGETKRRHLQPAPDRFDFTGTDTILDFVAKNNQQMRGHTLCWYLSNPDWLASALASNRDEKLLTDYIVTVAGRYRGRFHSWDVVNEAVEPNEGHPDGLRVNSMWFQAFGESYIATAFHAARSADPDALLFYNELNLEGDERWYERRRKATLALLERLKAKGAPIDALGIQGHLKAFRWRYSEEVFSRFLDDVVALGLKVMITEFDVADIEGPRDIQKRDAQVAMLARRMLDVAFSKPEVLGCLTWGISDRYSWLSRYEQYQWPDGQLSRGLPFDADYRRKPLWDAIGGAFDRPV